MRDSIRSEHEHGRLPVQNEIAWFGQQDVRATALVTTFDQAFSPIRVDTVAFLKRRTFEFERYLKRPEPVEPAFTFLARDFSGEIIDIVAWSAGSGQLASWLGRAALLGEDQVFAPRLDEAIEIHPGPVGWLRAKRRGLIIVDPRRARSILLEAGALQVSSVEQGIKLRDLLQKVRLPEILVAALPDDEERVA